MDNILKENTALRRRYELLLDRRRYLGPTVFERQRKELKKYRAVTLSKDPIEEGLLAINEKLADIQAHRDWVAALVAEVASSTVEWRAYMEDCANLYEDVVDLMMWMDPQVKSAKNQNLRLALARVRCPDVINLHAESRRRYFMAAGFEKECRDALENLDAANSNASRQVTVIQLAIELGDISRGQQATGIVRRKL